MNESSRKEMIDALETARIIAGAEMERLCSSRKHKEAQKYEILAALIQNHMLLQKE